MRTKIYMLMPALAALTILGIVGVGIILEARGQGDPWSALVAARSQAAAQASSGNSAPAAPPASEVEVAQAYEVAASNDSPPTTTVVATLGSGERKPESEGPGSAAEVPVVSPPPTEVSTQPSETTLESGPASSYTTFDSAPPSTVPAIVAVAAVGQGADSSSPRRPANGGAAAYDRVPLASAVDAPSSDSIEAADIEADEVETEMEND